MIKVYCHLHSKYSKDSLLSLKKIEKIAERNGVEAVILADHNNLAPKEEVEKIKKIKIILGGEIKTTEGEIIGLFLKEKIPARLSLKETIERIKKQGGLVMVPHPFDRFRRSVIKKKALLENIDQIDIIEIFNARNILNKDNKKAEDFARKYDKVSIVGSDAHCALEIDKAIIEMEDFSDPPDFLEKLKKARFYTKKSSLFIHLSSAFNKILKKLKIYK